MDVHLRFSFSPFILLFCLSFHQLFPLLDSIFDSAYVEEGLFGEIVHLAIKYHSEATDGVLNGNHHTGHTGKLLGYVEGL